MISGYNNIVYCVRDLFSSNEETHLTDISAMKMDNMLNLYLHFNHYSTGHFTHLSVFN